MAHYQYRFSIVACARWENAAICEWLIYHASIGCEHVYLYCNDDDPTELYQIVMPFLCGPAPFVTFLHYPFRGQQKFMYMHFLRTNLWTSEWISFLDIDEFLYLPGDTSIEKFLSRHEDDIDVFYFNWLVFGNNGHIERPIGDVLENYTRHQGTLHPLTKLLIRTVSITPESARDSGPFWHQLAKTPLIRRQINIFGDDVDDYYVDFPRRAAAYVSSTSKLAHALAEGVICHFSLKSVADLARRVARGTDGDFASQTIWGDHLRTGHHEELLAAMNAAQFTALREYWRGLKSRETIPSVMPRGQGINLALRKAATQSSVSPWSRHQDRSQDASGAVNGSITGGLQFCTSEEDEPWWAVDLAELAEIYEIRLFNRVDSTSFRSRHFALDVGSTEAEFSEVYRKADDADFGGIDGFPFRWVAQPGLRGRYVRVRLTSRNLLHLDQVEVYGRLVAGSAGSGADEQ